MGSGLGPSLDARLLDGDPTQVALPKHLGNAHSCPQLGALLPQPNLATIRTAAFLSRIDRFVGDFNYLVVIAIYDFLVHVDIAKRRCL